MNREISNLKFIGGFGISVVKTALNTFNIGTEGMKSIMPTLAKDVEELGTVKGGLQTGDRWSSEIVKAISIDEVQENIFSDYKKEKDYKGPIIL
jgi:hypothetical protein